MLDDDLVPQCHRKIKWNDLSDEMLAKYTANSEVSLSSVALNHHLVLCDSPNCKYPSHTSAITRMYNDIVNALSEASEELCQKAKNSYKQIPGWNDYCKIAHNDARNDYLMWRDHGKPKSGFIFETMRKSRAYFKHIVRKCKNDSDRHTADAVAKQLLAKAEKTFGKK